MSTRPGRKSLSLDTSRPPRCSCRGEPALNRHVFDDRRAAGTLLGVEIAKLRLDRPVVLGLPRGGVPVAAEVADALDAPLDVIAVRKLGVPFRRELAMGA